MRIIRNEAENNYNPNEVAPLSALQRYQWFLSAYPEASIAFERFVTETGNLPVISYKASISYATGENLYDGTFHVRTCQGFASRQPVEGRTYYAEEQVTMRLALECALMLAGFVREGEFDGITEDVGGSIPVTVHNSP